MKVATLETYTADGVGYSGKVYMLTVGGNVVYEPNTLIKYMGAQKLACRVWAIFHGYKITKATGGRTP